MNEQNRYVTCMQHRYDNLKLSHLCYVTFSQEKFTVMEVHDV